MATCLIMSGSDGISLIFKKSKSIYRIFAAVRVYYSALKKVWTFQRTSLMCMEPDLSDFQRDYFVGKHLLGASNNANANAFFIFFLFFVYFLVTLCKVIMAYWVGRKTLSTKQNSGRNFKLIESDPQVFKRIKEYHHSQNYSKTTTASADPIFAITIRRELYKNEINE